MTSVSGCYDSNKANGLYPAKSLMAVQRSQQPKDHQGIPVGIPSSSSPSRGPLMLFYKVGPSPSRWWGMLKSSNDEGKSWSEAQRLPEGFLGPIKNKPVQLANGDILCGSSTENAGWRVHFERSSDLGKTWSKTDAINDGKKIGAIEPSILFHPGNKLQAIGRSQQGRLGKHGQPITAKRGAR